MSDDKLTKWLAEKLLGTHERKASAAPAPAPAPSSSKPAQHAHAPSAHPKSQGSHTRTPHPARQGGHKPAHSRAAHPAPHAAKPAVHHRTAGATRIVALGGLETIGCNSMVFEHEKDILIVDLGFQFPDQDLLGIDYIIPDVSSLDDKKSNIRGILLTHGHLDHIGAIPYLIERLGFPPIYGTKLTLGIVARKLEEFGLQKRVRLEQITADDHLKFGHWSVDFFRVNHSIPDAVGIVLKSPNGTFVHTGDFKFDLSPSGVDRPAEFDKISALGNQNITALFSDSTNALRSGHTISEREVTKNLDELVSNAEGRIIIAAFSSLIGRIQQIMDIAIKYRRKVYISGRSMMETLEVAKVLGYLKYPKDLVHDAARMGKINDRDALILTTGSQGEDVSALSRISLGNHPTIRIKKNDMVVISATPIPGNERAVTTVINNLCRLGAKVIHSKLMDVHTSGHGAQEDLKLMITMVHPKYLVPVHGEYFMRQAHNELGKQLGMPEKQLVLVENGDVMEFKNGELRVTGEKIKTDYVLVDGLGTGDVGNQVIMDRQTMAENGVLVVLLSLDKKSNKLLRDPDIISRGFIYMNESEEVISKVSKEAKEIFMKSIGKKADMKRGEIKNNLKIGLEKMIHRMIERRPLILPVIAELGGDSEPKAPPSEHRH